MHVYVCVCVRVCVPILSVSFGLFWLLLEVSFLVFWWLLFYVCYLEGFG